MTEPDVLLTARTLRHGFPDHPDFLGPIDLDVRRTELLGIIGPNGAGKTTLLRLLAGIVQPQHGRVALGPDDLFTLAPRERARRIAYLPQRAADGLNATAMALVLMGRFPHRGYGLFESARDVEVCRRAMQATQTWEYAGREVATLSGGEAQRVHLAAALAQEPQLMLLDEPTSALDLAHQLRVFGLLRRLTSEQGLAVVAVTHDLNLAGRFCHRLLLLSQGTRVACGAPSEVLTDRILSPVYGVEFSVCRAEGDDQPWILPRRITDRGQCPPYEWPRDSGGLIRTPDAKSGAPDAAGNRAPHSAWGVLNPPATPPELSQTPYAPRDSTAGALDDVDDPR